MPAVIGSGPHQEDPGANEILTAGINQWSDPDWQTSTRIELAERGVEFILFQNGSEIYRSTSDPLQGNDHPGGMRQLNVDGSTTGQMALIYGDSWGPFGDDEEEWPIPVAAIGTLIMTFIGMALFFGRSVVKPLAATSSAATEIAGGNLD